MLRGYLTITQAGKLIKVTPVGIQGGVAHGNDAVGMIER
jgi:hypothetical protein